MDVFNGFSCCEMAIELKEKKRMNKTSHFQFCANFKFNIEAMVKISREI